MLLNRGIGKDSWDPLDCKIKQSILKEISPEYSFEGLMLKLKLQYFGHLMLRADSFEKTLILGKIEGGRRRGRQMMRLLDGITDWMDMSLHKLWDRKAWHAAVHGVRKCQTRLSGWTELIAICTNIDKPREYHTKWSKSKTKTNIIYTWNQNIIQKNLYAQ